MMAPATAAEWSLRTNRQTRGQPETQTGPGAASEDSNPPSREAAFAALVDRHARHLFRVAYSLLRNPADAEDAVQEALLKLFRGEAWRSLTNERAFLAQTVWRVGLDRMEARLRARAATEPLDAAGETDLCDPHAGPEEISSDGQQRALLRRLIHALPEDLRQPLLLSAIDELTSAEIAVILSIPEGTVRTRLMRARAELRRRFEATEQLATRTTPQIVKGPAR